MLNQAIEECPSVPWQVRDRVEPSVELRQIADKRKLCPVIVQLLAQRGLQDTNSIEQFLEPRLADLPEPGLMLGMSEAARLAGSAIMDGVPILVWGDYDVDGTTGVALLVSFFRELGAQVQYIIPNRITHGYGLHVDLLKGFAGADARRGQLLITVDCGISANSEIKAAQEIGFKVIVTDHHQPPAGDFAADVILNPKQSVCTFPTEEMAGVGVAFYLACGIRQFLRDKNFFHSQRIEPDVRNYLDLVALGTIADVVPLGAVNRILVKSGMKALEKQTRIGVQAMLEVQGLRNGKQQVIGAIRSEDIGFLLAPMINAAGRLADAELAVELLISQNHDKAMALAGQLMALNEERKKIGHQVYAKALAMKKEADAKCNCLIFCGNFHHGVIGIVAARLVERFQVPVIVFSKEAHRDGGQVLKGSGRSVQGVDISAVLEKCSDLLIRYGGHAMAAGLSIYEKDLELFKQAMDREIKGQHVKQAVQQKRMTADVVADFEEIFAPECQEQLQQLEPFGPENPVPMFYVNNAIVEETGTMGANNEHLRITFKGRRRCHNGVGFNLGSLKQKILQGRRAGVAFTATANRYRNNLTWQAKIAGISFSS